MSTDDGDIEDDGLSAFRSAWRTMPDEEPPQRGLAELMAAAREKADEMASARSGQEAGPSRSLTRGKQPSLWQRFVDMMRRPQVLALATIMILIGGAVFISQRRDKLEAHDPEGAPAATTATMGSGAAGEGRADELGSAQDKSKEAMREVSATPPEVPAGKNDRDQADLKIAAPEVATPPRTSTEKPQTQSVSKKMKPSKNKAGYEGDMDSPFDDGFSGGDASGASGAKVGGAGGGGGGTATSTGATTTATPPPPPPDSKPKAEPKAEEEQAPSTVKQLYEQARSAAAKGDCALVRSLAKKIAAKDPAYYRANIAPDKSLASCLN